MHTPQAGIFALGTASQCYLEFDLREGVEPAALVGALADLREPRTTVGGVNLVVGLRPELWRAVAPSETPEEVAGFDAPVEGVEGFVMPATQHDAVLWVTGNAYDVVFDEGRGSIAALEPVASVASEITSWPYRHDRDLTGFIDGTENPSLAEVPEIAVVPDGSPGAGGSVLLLQQWVHDADAWEALPVATQEAVMGRTKPDSVELDPRPEDSHVARNDQDDFGHVFRRNMPYGTVSDHGTMFVGFAASQAPLAAMLDSMAGRTNGVRDALTRYTHPVSGAYYFVPSVQGLRAFASPEEDDD